MSEQAATRVPLPSTAGVRNQVGRFIELWLDGMFLKEEGYAYERDSKNPLGNGLVYIAIIGVMVAVANIIGAGIRYATSPTADAVKNTVLTHLQAMPFYATLTPAVANSFEQGYDQVWDTAGSLFLGYPTDATSFVGLMLSVLTTPLGLIVCWLVYGALVHVIARGWNPETSYAELLAPLALATSPQILNTLAIFPGVGASGVVVALWTFVCNIFAIRVAYKTTARRAVWGAVFPLLVVALLFVLLAACGFGFLSSTSVQRIPE
jgi:hypothetical protein